MIDVRDFEKEVLERSEAVPVLVDFWAEWCQPCRILGPILEQLEAQSGGKWVLAKVNVDHHPHVAQSYQVSGIPAVKLIWKKQVIAEFVGALPPNYIQQWLKAHLPNHESESLFYEALNALRNHQIYTAIEKLQLLLEREPNHAEGAMMLFRIGIRNQDWELAQKALHHLRNCSEYEHLYKGFEQVLLFLADKLELPESPVKSKLEGSKEAFLNHDYENAIDLAIQGVAMDKHYANELPRNLVLTYFELLGRDSELVAKYRRAFQMALF